MSPPPRNLEKKVNMRYQLMKNITPPLSKELRRETVRSGF